ncbi:hypothetical protein FisN_1Hu472 [Fistulifera solaris]|uniref:Calmodulin-lysine N-methyltransferase n=1 Tax=Fistulifera solaris TaxID=1519565 RepID=A0A1Z5JJT8_FISSO|nr:hypothetical protein FisN_1Hu472 [Fistulifera solaris]|eukprot:GAX14277.1 hypothetical protein FisN_1Hu472 [Fistulifera solaris]
MDASEFATTDTAHDEFWDIALETHGTASLTAHVDDASSSSSEDHSFITTTRITYRLECPSRPPFRVSLSPLAPKSGIWSPLGSDIWYGSALLTAFLFTEEDHPAAERLHRFLKTNLASEIMREFSVLELGSGAVGLTGLAAGWMLRYHPTITSEDGLTRPIRIILTDNDEDVLRQLRQNIDHNIDAVQHTPSTTRQSINYSVEYLDWHEPSPLLSPVQFVVGSELVYNNETAKACFEVVCSLIDQNPHVLILIIQVSDRDGWRNRFIPGLQQRDNVVVVESVLSDPLLHERAASLVRFGGTLNREDYSLCYVYNDQMSF